ncbi:MAG: toll/interleukin-1 receptor domain-containing protein [Terriglobia bacterium]
MGLYDLRHGHPGGSGLVGADGSVAQVGYTSFGDNALTTVKRLETVQHYGPSTIGLDTIYKFKGSITEVFLRGAGVPENFIVYMRSLVGKPIDFYSCFISYSSQDADFAQRLHADLQQQGVRCWFAPEDLKIGDKFRTRIDESIRIYDKVMVVLSENSIPSGWVEKEVETAFEREQREKKLVLFPIRLDDAVMDTDQAWAADIRRVRHIGDFRAWKDHGQYQKSFERLLRDLKTW